MSEAGQVLVGDCMEALQSLPEGSVHCCVTSPPYYRLRDYGDPRQVGTEETVEAYVVRLVEVFRLVRRALRPDGTLWLNLGDSYTGGSRTPDDSVDLKHGMRDHARRIASDVSGQLLGIPWRVALALQADGWVLRSDVVWAKRNCLPESVAGWRWVPCRVKVGASRPGGQKSAEVGHRSKQHGNLEDQPSVTWERCSGCPRCEPGGGFVLRRGSWRPTRAHEFVFMLAPSPSYYSSGEQVREPHTHFQARPHGHRRRRPGPELQEHVWEGTARSSSGPDGDPAGRNLRDVWHLSSHPSKLHHYAMMPPVLVEKCLLAGCPELACGQCGRPYAPQVDRQTYRSISGERSMDKTHCGVVRAGWRRGGPAGSCFGLRACCTCGADPVPGTVLDPFLGAGTVAGVAEHLGRRWVGVELNPDYAALLPARVEEVLAYYARRQDRRPKPAAGLPEPRQLGLF